MSHARRKFFDALANDKDRAGYALLLFGQLYALERKIKDEGLTEEEALKLRQEKAMPVLKELREWMLVEYPKVLSTSPIGNGIAYFLKRWDKLVVYTTDTSLKIDNNPVENAVRPIATARKSYLFAGSHEAARRAAMIYSLFATCR